VREEVQIETLVTQTATQMGRIDILINNAGIFQMRPLMATTNGTFGSTTFGISTGTSGCTNDGKVMAEQKTTVFAELNFENLSQEMAQGQGEHLASLATLMGLPAENHAAFFALTQERYTSLIKTGEASPVAMVKAINDAISAHPVLAKASTR